MPYGEGGGGLMDASVLGKRKSRGEMIASQCDRREGWMKEDGQPGSFSQRQQGGAVQCTLGSPRKKMKATLEGREESLVSNQAEGSKEVAQTSKANNNEACKPPGFKNGRNLCYMASILQVVLSVQGFVEELNALKDTEIFNKLPEDGIIKTLLVLIQDRAEAIANNNTDCALDFKYLPVLAEKRFGFKHLTQQDAAEFYSQMLDAIQEEIIAVESESYKNGKVPFSKTKCPASRKFQFAVQTQSVGECKKTSKMEVEGQWNRDILVEDKNSIADGLYKLFHENEENHMYCESCRERHNFTQSKKFHRLPEVLTIHAVRNQHTGGDSLTQMPGKCMTHLNVPTIIKVDDGQITVPMSSITNPEPYVGETSSQTKSTCETIIGAPSPKKDAPVRYLPNTCSQSCENGVESVSGAILSPEKKQQALVGGAESKVSQNGQNPSPTHDYEDIIPTSQEQADKQLEMALQASMKDLNDISDTFISEMDKSLGSTSQETQPAQFERKGTLIEDSKKLLTTSATYELFGYVNHFGAKVVEGHYTACIKTETGNWLQCNDDSVKPLLQPMEDVEKASLFFYKRQ